MTWVHLAAAYLVGGVTFLPLVLLVVFWRPTKTKDQTLAPWRAGEIEEKANSGLDCVKQGWIYVTHEPLPSLDELSNNGETVGESPDARSAYLLLYKLVTKAEDGRDESSVKTEHPGQPQNSVTSQGTGPVPAAGPKPPAAPLVASKKHRYFGVLKHGNLFLYKDERMHNVKHVIVLLHHTVALWPRTLLDALLFTKYSLIAILKSEWLRPRRFLDVDRSADPHHVTLADVLQPGLSWPAPQGLIFVYTDTNSDKEDWYFALVRASKDTAGPLAAESHARTLHLDTEALVALIRTLYGSEGQLQLKWFNALVGRLFLALQNTDMMKDYLVGRIERKLNKIKTPGFLDKFQITKVVPGFLAPFLTYPVLKEISPNGDLLLSFNVHYSGGISIQLATKVNINLGSRFKTREVDVLLSITLEHISGPMLLKMKPPPSARLWYTYEREPAMSLKIEPVISSRQLSYPIITSTIEKKFKEALRDSLVLPHWDDLVFYPTPESLYRGGIWENFTGPTEPPEHPQEPQVPAQLADPEVSLNDELLEEKVDLIDLAQNRSKKLASSLTNMTKRLRKPKSTHTLGVVETHCMADGRVIEGRLYASSYADSVFSESSAETPVDLPTAEPKTGPSSESFNSSTLRKIGEWYSKDKAKPPAPAEPYRPPEMISNRRSRNHSLSTAGAGLDRAESEKAGYDFGSEIKTTTLANPIQVTASVSASSPTSLTVSSPASAPRNLLAQTDDPSLLTAEPAHPQLGMLRTNLAITRKPPPEMEPPKPLL